MFIVKRFLHLDEAQEIQETPAALQQLTCLMIRKAQNLVYLFFLNLLLCWKISVIKEGAQAV